MVPSPHLWFLHAKQRLLDQNYKSLCVPDIACWFVDAKQSKYHQISMGPSPHLWFLHTKQRLLDQNYKSLWVPDIACWFVHTNSANSSRFTNLHGTQNSPVVLCMQNNVTSIKIICLYRSHPSFVVFACKTATLGPELQVSTCLRPHLWFFAFKTATLQQNCKSLCLPALICGFEHSQQRHYDQN